MTISAVFDAVAYINQRPLEVTYISQNEYFNSTSSNSNAKTELLHRRGLGSGAFDITKDDSAASEGVHLLDGACAYAKALKATSWAEMVYQHFVGNRTGSAEREQTHDAKLSAKEAH
jgi:hypothetical protein